MEKMSRGSVSESKGKYSMSQEGQTFTDRMDRITLLLVGMLLELLPTLAQVCWGPIFGPNKVWLSSLSRVENGLQIQFWSRFLLRIIRTIWKSTKTAFWHMIINLVYLAIIMCQFAVLVDFQTVRMDASGPNLKWNSGQKVHFRSISNTW